MEALTGMGEKIKSLRKGRNMTQQQLADCLNISFQSVSKWETGEAYPDISMIPKLAVIFDTTADEVLCIDKAKMESEVEKYIEEMGKYNTLGDIDKMLETMREANEKFPGNFKVIYYLIYAMGMVALRDKNLELDREIIEKGEYLLSECTDGEIRGFAITGVAHSYIRLGMREKARQVVKKNCTGIYSSTDMMLEALEEEGSDEKITLMQENMMKCFSFFEKYICSLSSELPLEEMAEVYENLAKMYSMIFPRGDFGFYHGDIAGKYNGLTGIYLKLENYEKALECLQKNCDHTVARDLLAIDTPHTSPLVNKLVYKGIWKNNKGNGSYHMREQLGWKGYNPIRDTDQFRQIEDTLKKYADENA